MAVSVVKLVDAEWDFAYRTHAPALLRYLRRLSRSQEIAEELMQETFGRAIRSGAGPDATDEMRPWLYRIATNLAIDQLRRERRLRFLPFLGNEVAPERNSDEIDSVRRVLRAIPPDQAVALVLRLHEGFAPREIGELLGVTEAAVKSRLVRGRRNFVIAYRRIGGRP